MAINDSELMSAVLDLAALTEAHNDPCKRSFEGWELQDAAKRCLGEQVGAADLNVGTPLGKRKLGPQRDERRIFRSPWLAACP